MGAYQFFVFFFTVLLTAGVFTTYTHSMAQCKVKVNRKVNEVLVASKGPFLTDMGHSISFFFSPLTTFHRCLF